MRTFFCKKAVPKQELGKISVNKIPSVKTKFSFTPPIDKKEFQSIFNIEYIEYDEEIIYATIYDKLMSKEVFAVNYKDLDHKKIFEEYELFNKKIGEKINKICEEDDLVIVNDSHLLLLPEIVKCRVAFRNLKFNHSFIERLPNYSRIIKCLFLGQKFFNSFQDYESFKNYYDCSYELADYEIGGCWFIKPYVDKFLIIDVLEHYKYFFEKQECNEALNPDRFEENIMKKIENLQIPKKGKTVLATVYPPHIEQFLKENKDITVRYLENFNYLSENDHKTLVYLKTLYGENFELIEARTYSEVVVEMAYCDVYIGDHYKEIAKCFAKEVICDNFDVKELTAKIKKALDRKIHKISEDLLGEEEYIKEFMRINGYDIQLSTDIGEDEIIEKHLREIYKNIGISDEYLFKSDLIKNKELGKENNLFSPMYCKMDEEADEKVYYYRKEDLIDTFNINLKYNTQSEIKRVNGFNTYDELLNKPKKKELNKIDIDKFMKYWNDSNKIILADYDGTISEIQKDPKMAFPTPELKELFNKFIKASKTKLILCTGRSQETCDEWFPLELEIYAEHGALHRVNGKWRETSKISCLDEIEELMQYYCDRVPSTSIEKKTTGIAFHYRMAPLFDPSILYGQLKRVAGQNVTRGKEVIEVRSSSKDRVCEIINPALALGDDITDEDMFRVNKGISLRVGKGMSLADAYVDDVPELLKLLNSLIE